jgi:hypothetical protein
MFPSQDPDEVLTGLGDEFLRALAGAVVSARMDISEMRAWRPGWFPPMSVRCLANLIHDRIWAHFAAAVDGSTAMHLVQSGPTREVQVGMNFRLRIKRHHNDDGISTYPTETALDFYLQEQMPIEGLELVKLTAGYRWDAEMREILAPVISYRDGKDNPIWAVELSEPDAETAPIRWAPIATPSLPLVDLGDAAAKSETGSEDQ